MAYLLSNEQIEVAKNIVRFTSREIAADYKKGAVLAAIMTKLNAPLENWGCVLCIHDAKTILKSEIRKWQQKNTDSNRTRLIQGH